MEYLQLDRFHSQGRPIVKHPVEFPPIEVAIGCIHLQAQKKKRKANENIIIGISVQQNTLKWMRIFPIKYELSKCTDIVDDVCAVSKCRKEKIKSNS